MGLGLVTLHGAGHETEHVQIEGIIMLVMMLQQVVKNILLIVKLPTDLKIQV